MDVKPLLVSQFRATFAMLRDCIEMCPEDAWAQGEHPRTFWRITYHALYYTHLYLSPTVEDFEPWERHVPHARVLWDDDEDGVPPRETTFSRADLLGYLDDLHGRVPEFIERIDLSSGDSGFPWYKNMSKLEHLMLTLRHLGTHVGQLQERLYPLGVEPRWISRG